MVGARGTAGTLGGLRGMPSSPSLSRAVPTCTNPFASPVVTQPTLPSTNPFQTNGFSQGKTSLPLTGAAHAPVATPWRPMTEEQPRGCDPGAPLPHGEEVREG